LVIGIRSTAGILLAVDFAVPLEIVSLEQDVTRSALKTFKVEAASFGTCAVTFHRLEVLALDAVVTGTAQGAVTLMVVLRAIRPVVQDVEIGRWEGGVAFKADKASTVVSTSQTAVGGGNRFASDFLAATLAVTLGTISGASWRTRNRFRRRPLYRTPR
jgi:hypothetical protein